MMLCKCVKSVTSIEGTFLCFEWRYSVTALQHGCCMWFSVTRVIKYVLHALQIRLKGGNLWL